MRNYGWALNTQPNFISILYARYIKDDSDKKKYSILLPDFYGIKNQWSSTRHIKI